GIGAGRRHPNVVDVYEVTEDAGTYFMAMEFLQGPSLSQLMKECRNSQEAMPLGAAVEIVIQAASGLHHAHTKTDIRGKSLKIVHRDVSPQNILVTQQGVTKVIDFGIARVIGRASHSRPGTIRGKASYMSPEQASGKELDSRTDLFSLAIILWELTTN